jgi:succinate-semialdehyde dehydrogenase/glutarate-semialdehyde dehydrogenase
LAIKSINPANGELIKEYDELSPEQVKDIIRKVHETFLNWQKTSFAQRAEKMKKAAQILRDNTEEYARLMTAEMGKTIKEGHAEANKCAWVCDYYADNAANFLQREMVQTDAGKSFVTFPPLGVVLAVMPWNFPFWQVFRFAAPALMAGNTGVLKHASNVPGCALAIEDIFRKAGFPENAFRTAVAKKAGEMLKKTVLELGGSDAYVMLEDADLQEAVTTCVNSRLINSGQSCIAAKRFIVVEPLAGRFEKLYVEKMKAKKMGDPLQEDTDIAPQAREDLRDDLHRQVRESITMGAKCLLGGEIPKEKGAYYPATVLTAVKKGMPAYDEELFGPVAAIIPVKDEEEALRAANDSVFGLGAAVFTKDIARGEKIAAERLEAGACFVNSFVKSDPRLPFGGIKESGYGRELSHYGIKEFVNIKTVYIK